MNVDERLRELNGKIGHTAWLKFLIPENLKEERKKVFENPLYNPQFKYPEVSFDRREIKRELKVLREEIDDSDIYGFLQKELINNLEMYFNSILVRGSEDFQEIIEKLCLKPAQEDVEWAKEFYKKDVEKEPAVVSPETVAEEFRSYLRTCGIEHEYSIEISDKIANIIVLEDERKILIPKKYRSLSALKGLKIHEIGTHVVCYENGCLQPYALFSIGFPFRYFTSEGLALVNEERVGAQTDEKRKKRAGNIIAMVMAEENPFCDIYNVLLKAGFSKEEAFVCAYHSKRGLCDTSKKGANFLRNVYVAGRKMVKEYLDSGGDEEILYTGRVSVQYISHIKQLDGVIQPKYKPNFDV